MKKIKLSGEHKKFFYAYRATRYNPGLYNRIYFPSHDEVAIVHPKSDPLDSATWGLVNMNNQYILPFEFERIRMFGKQFILADDGYELAIYNRQGKKLHTISCVRRTKNSAYWIIRNEDAFWLTIDRNTMSKGSFDRYRLLDDGLMYLRLYDKDLCGIIRYTKLFLPFEYTAISTIDGGYCIGIKKDDNNRYICELIKVRSNYSKPNPIHPTGITLADNLTFDELQAFINNKEEIQCILDGIVCYNSKVIMNYSSLSWFPKGLIDIDEVIDIDDEEEEEEEDDDNDLDAGYDYWQNYSSEEALYDALGGEMEAVWNID